ncbi:MAG: phosphomannomutase/phosphoglucomutase [Desulfobacteraceae bacterium]|nr:MAG: phosphomannomutase/phosphoglucomutase [Desulfobacteraceae bacterium]
MKETIFREYDIRGRIPDELNGDVAYRIGLALGTYYGERGVDTISMGRDCRLSSPELKDALSRGLIRTGMRIVDVGIVPTPLLYFSLFHLDVKGGVQITGSHNPPDNNGFKICIGRSPVFGEEIQKIKEITFRGEFRKGEGGAEAVDVMPAYLKDLRARLRPGRRKAKVVVDAGNGVGGMVAPELFEEIGAEVVPLFCEPDGRFPNHHPDPTIPEYLTSLIQKVSEEHADLGIAFDGDADRIGVVDEDGKILWGDQLMILFSRSILKENPGAKIIGEVKCSQVFYDDVARNGGKPIMWKAGHSLIKGKMKEESALFAGEMSGHLFFADRYYGYDDAVYAGARLLEIVTNTGRSVKELMADVPRMVNTPEIRIDCPDELKFQVVAELVAEFKKEYEVVDIDGARVQMKGGWGLVRPSNTQPVLVLRFEAGDEKTLEEIRAVFMEKLHRVTREKRPKNQKEEGRPLS